MKTNEELVEPKITPEIRKWIEWYIQGLMTSSQYWLKRSSALEKDNPRGSDECFGRSTAYEQEAIGLNYTLYCLDNPFTGDVANKHEWE